MIAATPARGAIASAKSKGIGERQHGERGLGGDAELAMTQPSALNLCAKSTFNQFLEVSRPALGLGSPLARIRAEG
jgi:hypothetical protein